MMLTLLFQKSADKFEIVNKTCSFWFGVQFLLKKSESDIHSKENTVWWWWCFVMFIWAPWLHHHVCLESSRNDFIIMGALTMFCQRRQIIIIGFKTQTSKQFCYLTCIFSNLLCIVYEFGAKLFIMKYNGGEIFKKKSYLRQMHTGRLLEFK